LRVFTLSGYTLGMKTAISIPDDVFSEADQLARETKQSRSQLYTRAVREYVARHSADSVTAALDALVVGEPDSGFATAAGRSILERSEW
jgi:predicted transcriptional regulator